MDDERFDEDFSSPDTEPVDTDDGDIELNDEPQGQQSDDGDSFQKMQDRMSDDIEPWFSESVNKVVDQDGNDILDENGKPFRSIDDYEKSLNTGKPENNEGSDSSDSSDGGDKAQPITSFTNSPVTLDVLNERVKSGQGFKYQDELLPKIETKDSSGKPVPESANLDPVTKVKAMYNTWTGIAVNPLKDISDKMVKELVVQGADQHIASNIVSQVINPILQQQSEAVDKLYKDEYEKAVYQQLESKVNGTIGETEAAKLNALSEKNVDDLSKTYFPKHGKAALYELLNGYHAKAGDPSSFTRGQAAHVMDLLTSLHKGDKFSSNQELGKAINDTFVMLTSDKNKANVLFDLLHYYSIGKNFAKVKDVTYKQGKEDAIKQTQRVKRTVRNRPISKRPPSSSMDGLPSAIRSFLMSD
jgi:hypothetical protein